MAASAILPSFDRHIMGLSSGAVLLTLDENLDHKNAHYFMIFYVMFDFAISDN